MSKRRSYFDILAERLETARGGAKKTVIMQRYNLKPLQTKELFLRLLDTQLLEKGISYRTTETGLHFHKTYRDLDLLIRKEIS